MGRYRISIRLREERATVEAKTELEAPDRNEAMLLGLQKLHTVFDDHTSGTAIIEVRPLAEGGETVGFPALRQ
jgi:hypothetical protein